MPARTDLVTDDRVIRDLAHVRLGTAHLRRTLNGLTDRDLDGPSLLPGWTRRHVLAHVGYNARGIARLVDWAATGVRTPMYASAEARVAEIEDGATLAPDALRNLVEHAAIDLDVRWRDLPADRWSFPVVTPQGREVPVAETVWMRTREVWLHAADLAADATVDQIPVEVLSRLLDDIHGTWRKRDAEGLPSLVDVDDGSQPRWPGGPHGVVVAGTVVALAAWATGRMRPERRTTDLAWPQGGPTEAPRWI
jgi:maleylpyruvate isomerase